MSLLGPSLGTGLFTVVGSLLATLSLLGGSSPGDAASVPTLAEFWKPWFTYLGGGTPVASAPFLELAGDLRPHSTLTINCSGLKQPELVVLVAGYSLWLTPDATGAVLVPKPEFLLLPDVHTYDDDGPGGKAGYTGLEMSVAFGPSLPPTPYVFVQIWSLNGGVWTASNAVAANFDVAGQQGP